MMKFFRPEGAEAPSARVDRRGLVVGAGAAGVATVAVAMLARRVAAAAPPVGHAKLARVADEGYRETEHVLRYYDSTRS